MELVWDWLLQAGLVKSSEKVGLFCDVIPLAPIYSCHSFDIEVSRIAIAFWDEELCQPIIQQAIIYPFEVWTSLASED